MILRTVQMDMVASSPKLSLTLALTSLGGKPWVRRSAARVRALLRREGKSGKKC